MLLDAGLDPNADRVQAKTLLDYCVSEGHDEVAEILRQHGAERRSELGWFGAGRRAVTCAAHSAEAPRSPPSATLRRCGEEIQDTSALPLKTA